MRCFSRAPRCRTAVRTGLQTALHEKGGAKTPPRSPPRCRERGQDQENGCFHTRKLVYKYNASAKGSSSPGPDRLLVPTAAQLPLSSPVSFGVTGVFRVRRAEPRYPAKSPHYATSKTPRTRPPAGPRRSCANATYHPPPGPPAYQQLNTGFLALTISSLSTITFR